jgi:hypothetical protein
MDDWHIRTQGMHSKNLRLDISRNGDGYVITFKTLYEFYKIYFSPSGQITHIKHYDGEISHAPQSAPVAESSFKPDRPRQL